MADARRLRSTAQQIGVNPAACDGVGICAHIASDLIRVDSWGYPILTRNPINRREERQAYAAVAACPRRALFIVAG